MMWFSKPPTPRRPVTRRVRDLEIASARLLRAGFAGDYQSAFHGRGIEFSQVREYQPGDDIRTIDWNVTARHGTPFVKEFVEERDLTIIVVVDVSASMAFGSADWRKADLAAELTAIFAFSAVQNADRAGLLLFSDGVRTFIPPRRGHPHAQLIVRTAADAAMEECEGNADIDFAATFLDRVNVHRAVLIVISDFLDLHFERALQRLGRRHDVVAMALFDPREERFPSKGLARLRDAESGEQRLVDLPAGEVSRRAVQRHQQLERRFRSTGTDWLAISTAIPYDRDLLRFFRQRSLRR